MHNSSASDAFTPQMASSNLIPDDWDDLLSPVSEPPRPITSQPVSIPPAGYSNPWPTAAGLPHQSTGHGSTNSCAASNAPPLTAPPLTEPPLTAPRHTLPPVAPMHGRINRSTRTRIRRRRSTCLSGCIWCREDLVIADDDLVNTMARMGRMTKALITGLREILMTRTSIKSEFRIEQTMINAGGNNPLKFSISAEQAIEAMVRPATTRLSECPETATEAGLERHQSP